MNSTTKLYDNLEILCPDGNLLGHCNVDKFKWYIKRDLAVQLSEKTLQLKFIPKEWDGKVPNNLTEKKNICVNCGTKEELTKHHVIPRVYIKYFPLEIKSNNSHDVVLLCADCHSDYELEATKLKKELAIKYDAPLNVQKKDSALTKAYSCLVHLLNYQHRQEWKQTNLILNMMFTVNKYLPDAKFNDDDLHLLRNRVAEINRISHGKKVLDQITDYQEFVEMWRNHFIDTMDPQFMPNGWDIKTNIYTK